MSDVIKVYKIKDIETGLFKCANGSWSKTGKTWNSLGNLKNSLHHYQDTDYKTGDYRLDLPEPNLVIIEIEVVQTESNSKTVQEFVLEERRKARLAKDYGSSLVNLIERIEDQGLRDKFKWVLYGGNGYNYTTRENETTFSDMMDECRRLGLKANRDFKKASRDREGGAIAFVNKTHAMQVRLGISGKVSSFDINQLIETNLDEAEAPC